MTRCGIVTIVGRPNVGKSTLLNRLTGQKLSITSRKPQTTRQRILGIRTQGSDQVIYVDTPGLHARPHKTLNRRMQREALGALEGIDLILFVVLGAHWTESDEYVLQQLQGSPVPVILVVNKVDKFADKRELLPVLEQLATKGHFAEIVPVSARTGENVDELQRCIAARLPQREHIFPEDQVSDRSERFFVAELIREKLIRLLGQELPYSTSVIVDEFAEHPRLVNIGATIWVERSGQKPIVIGRGGEMLRRIGEQARRDIERFLGKKVFLQTWVKVREYWADDGNLLRQLGLHAD